ncbi:MAG: T9SS type A sorting domain-containing protein [Sphingobacteriaceae bacterium]|nr:T9SS type A sorting domain-containing protein [Sphingobacteriaceae bacterium]
MYTYTNPTNGCVNSATATILVVNCTSINEENAFVKNISIYPNPTKGHIVVETNSDMDKTITILDARGRIIRNETSKQRTLQYSIADEANGIYFIKISSSLGSREFKLVKE